MKKFLFLLVAILTATAVNAQLNYTKDGKLTFGNISFPDNTLVTAWEGAGHYYHNGSSSSGDTWLKLDLSDNYPALVPGGGLLLMKSNAGGCSFSVDLTHGKPYIYSNSSSLFFKNKSTGQNIYAGGLYTSARTHSSNSAVLEGALDKVARLVPRQFTPGPISARRNTFYGFLSGEMERVLPELVNSDEEGAKYINYTEIIPILTKAIQDLTLKVLEQEERIAELEQPSDHKTKP